MWASVIKSVGLDLFCFTFEFSAGVMGPLISALTGIAMVAFPPLTFIVVEAIAPNRLVGHWGGGFDILVGHVDVVRQV
jgi:hypothetical protein